MRKGKWYGITVCKECEQRLTDLEIRTNLGICPKCGHKDKEHPNDNYCQIFVVILRKIKHHQWWEFWKRKVTYEGKDDFSEYWISRYV